MVAAEKQQFSRTITKIRDDVINEFDNIQYTGDISTALKDNRDVIASFVFFYCYRNEESDKEIRDLKTEIYTIYTTRIASVIADIEVYTHTLNKQIVHMIGDLCQDIVIAEQEKDISNKKILLNHAKKLSYVLLGYFQELLIKVYLKNIKRYIKLMSVFNKGIKTDDDKYLIDVVKSEHKHIKQSYDLCHNKLCKYLTIDKNYVSYSVSDYDEEIGFEEVLNLAKTTYTKCESNYSSVVSNGYKSSILKKILAWILMWGLPSVIMIASCILIIQRYI